MGLQTSSNPHKLQMHPGKKINIMLVYIRHAGTQSPEIFMQWKHTTGTYGWPEMVTESDNPLGPYVHGDQVWLLLAKASKDFALDTYALVLIRKDAMMWPENEQSGAWISMSNVLYHMKMPHNKVNGRRITEYMLTTIMPFFYQYAPYVFDPVKPIDAILVFIRPNMRPVHDDIYLMKHPTQQVFGFLTQKFTQAWLGKARHPDAEWLHLEGSSYAAVQIIFGSHKERLVKNLGGQWIPVDLDQIKILQRNVTLTKRTRDHLITNIMPYLQARHLLLFGRRSEPGYRKVTV